MVPASYWRRRSNTAATAISATARITNKPNGHQRRSTKGRICCAQAIGENQLKTLPELSMTSPAPRTSAATASTAIAAPDAVRACRHSCAVTAATAPNTMATPVMPRHMAAVSAMPKPVEAIARVMVTASTALRPPTRMRAAVVRAYRPTTEESTNSAVPFSSSARV